MAQPTADTSILHMLNNLILRVLWVSLFVASTAYADSGLKPMAADSPLKGFAGALGLVSHPGGNQIGNAFAIGENGCDIITNFHVAFGVGRNQKTGGTVIADNAEPGQVVEFYYDYNPRTRKMQKRMKATVTKIGNYDNDSVEGFRQDMTALRLETCLGKGSGITDFDRPGPTKYVPTGPLATLGILIDSTDGSLTLVEQDCESLVASPAPGMNVSNCEVRPSLSGSMVFEKGDDGKWRLAGIPTQGGRLKDGRRILKSVYADYLTPFIDEVLGTPVSSRKTTNNSGPAGSKTVVSPNATP